MGTGRGVRCYAGGTCTTTLVPNIQTDAWANTAYSGTAPEVLTSAGFIAGGTIRNVSGSARAHNYDLDFASRYSRCAVLAVLFGLYQLHQCIRKSQRVLCTFSSARKPVLVRSPFSVPLQVRLWDDTPPTLTWVAAWASSSTVIEIALQLDEVGTAYCEASARTAWLCSWRPTA